MAVLLLVGCQSSHPKKEFADIPDLNPPAGQVPANSSTAPATSSSVQTQPVPVANKPQPTKLAPTALALSPNSATDILRTGESVVVTFADIQPPIQPMEQKISDDGQITLPYHQTFKADGKTTTELANEIRERYVPKIFVNLTVTVSHTATRVYYVDGEVKQPSRQVWTGPITLTGAINSCGGFTEFARRGHIHLIRADRRVLYFDYRKILKNPQLDPQIYPDDKIFVPRTIW